MLKEEDLESLVAFISSARNQWRDVGRNLGFKHAELAAIVPKAGLTSQVDYFTEMLSCYMKWAPPNKPYPSTEDVIAALRNVGEHNLARRLEQDSEYFMADRRLQ